MLRPMFTRSLADMLRAGRHVNLIAPHGRGRRQTLADLLLLLTDIPVQKIDLKRERGEWASWLDKTLCMGGQVVVIIHNIEYMEGAQKAALQALKEQVLLCVSEKPLPYAWMRKVEIPA